MLHTFTGWKWKFRLLALVLNVDEVISFICARNSCMCVWVCICARVRRAHSVYVCVFCALSHIENWNWKYAQLWPANFFHLLNLQHNCVYVWLCVLLCMCLYVEWYLIILFSFTESGTKCCTMTSKAVTLIPLSVLSLSIASDRKLCLICYPYILFVFRYSSAYCSPQVC